MSELVQSLTKVRQSISPYLYLFILLGGISVWALTQGAYQISWFSVLQTTGYSLDQDIIMDVRLPRLLMAMLVGTTLAVSGALMQALFRNPLADPGLLGIAAGASVAVGLLIVFGERWQFLQQVEWLKPYTSSFAAFIGATITCSVIFRLSKSQGKVSVLHLLLAGIAINAIAGSATGLLTYISSDEQLRALTFWAMGNLGGARWEHVFTLASLLSPMLIFLVIKSQQLNLLLLGEEEARYLGLDVERFKGQIVLVVALLVGVAVAFSGLIGFIGLMVPHLVRMMFGSDNRLVVPCSAILGATLLTSADTVARILVIPAELPVGLVTSLLGGPFFLWLLMRNIKGGQ